MLRKQQNQTKFIVLGVIFASGIGGILFLSQRNDPKVQKGESGLYPVAAPIEETVYQSKDARVKRAVRNKTASEEIVQEASNDLLSMTVEQYRSCLIFEAVARRLEVIKTVKGDATLSILLPQIHLSVLNKIDAKLSAKNPRNGGTLCQGLLEEMNIIFIDELAARGELPELGVSMPDDIASINKGESPALVNRAYNPRAIQLAGVTYKKSVADFLSSFNELRESIVENEDE